MERKGKNDPKWVETFMNKALGHLDVSVWMLSLLRVDEKVLSYAWFDIFLLGYGIDKI